MTKLAKQTAPQADVAKLASYRQQAEGLIQVLSDAPCETPEQEAWFSESLSSVRGLIKGLEDERTSITKVMMEAKRKVDRLFSPATKPLERCEAIIRAKLQTAATARFQAAAAAKALAESAAEAGDFEGVVDALAAAPVAAQLAGSSAKAVWVAKVVDFAALPDQYKQVNERALAAFVKGCEGEPAPMPGVVWELSATLRAKP